MKIVANCLVKNEENFIWYAINSAIEVCDEIIVWDQGSTDNTVPIIKSIENKKIKFRQVLGDVSLARQKMLEETQADWIFILDGDEIWHDDTIKNLRFSIDSMSSKIDVITVPNYMLIGDIFHWQEEAAGKYRSFN